MKKLYFPIMLMCFFLLFSVVCNGMNVRFLVVKTIDEYNEFIKSEQLPDNFVTYENIKQIGEFKNLTVRSYYYFGDFSAYHYELIDPSGYEVFFNITTDDEEYKDYPNTSDVNPQNMRELNKQASGTLKYDHNKLKYSYFNGKLRTIQWRSQGVQYVLSVSDYPDTSDTFTGKLMNLETASEAVDALLTAIESPDMPEKTPSWKMPLIIGSCAAVVAVAALGTVIVVKKKKSK